MSAIFMSVLVFNIAATAVVVLAFAADTIRVALGR